MQHIVRLSSFVFFSAMIIIIYFILSSEIDAYQKQIIPTQCFYRFFGDFDWSVGKIRWFLHFNKNPCV